MIDRDELKAKVLVCLILLGLALIMAWVFWEHAQWLEAHPEHRYARPDPPYWSR